MLLKSASIRHYKSLDNVVIEFTRPVTVLVGHNAAGKSNIVDCLRFVRDAVAVDLEHAISSRGGIGRVRQYSKTRPYKLSFHLEFTQNFEPTSVAREFYDFSIQSHTTNNYSVDAESATWFERSSGGESFTKANFLRDRGGQVNAGNDQRAYKLPLDQLALGPLRMLGRSNGWSIAQFIRDWRYSALYPNMLRQPASPDKDRVLSEDGRNWASVIKALRRSVRGRTALEKIYEAMRVILPNFKEVTVTTVGNYLIPRFAFSNKTHGQIEFDPVQLSDGTLRIFGILLALYQSPAPELLFIEEPEQTVHPGVLGVLADAFREASESTQIVVTTHSPQFIDHFVPDEVRVVYLDDGLTKVSAVRKMQIEAVKRRLMSMQDFMLSEGLLPELA